MKKSISSRIRITKRGKLIRRPMAVDHSRTRKTGKGVREKRLNVGLDYPMRKILNANS